MKTFWFFLLRFRWAYGCLPYTQKTRKIRTERKWKDRFCLPERKFFREKKTVDQNSQTEFQHGKCAFHLLGFTSFRPFGLDCLWSYRPRKTLGNGRAHLLGNFYSHYLTRPIYHKCLSTGFSFFRVNGKQPLTPLTTPIFDFHWVIRFLPTDSDSDSVSSEKQP